MKSNIAKDFGINASTLLMFLKNCEKLEREYSENNRGMPSWKRIRVTDYNNMNESFYRQFLKIRPQDILLSGLMLCAKTRDFAVTYGVNKEFETSQGWLRAFYSFTTLCSKA